IMLANGASLADNDGIGLYLDTDENPLTGGGERGISAGGFDYELTTGRPVAPRLCTRWQSINGPMGGFTALTPGSLTCSVAAGVVTFRINRADLAGSNGVNLLAISEVLDAASSRSVLHDQAP